MAGIIASEATRAALQAAMKGFDRDLGFWPATFEAENGRPPNEDEIRKYREELVALQEQCRRDQERKDRQAREDVTIMVGTCQCGSEISYRSQFVAIGSSWDFPIGSRIPTKEECECSCVGCGLMYSPWHKPFRERLKTHRERLD